MEIAVIGMGYVGLVTAACLAAEGHKIVGVDLAQQKIEMINDGASPIVEKDVDELVATAVKEQRLLATNDFRAALAEAEMAIVCVGTPSRPNGSLDTVHVESVARELGREIRNRRKNLLVVMRSTMLPGTMKNLILPVLERESGLPAGEGYEVVFHPEFLRESTSIHDFYNPPKIVIGERIPGAGERLLSIYTAKFEAPRICTSLEEAEMVKYCDNLFHALKVTFANEIGQFCASQGVDSTTVMDVFCQDTKLNISPKYLKPGFAFGGSCLPKDLRAFLFKARQMDLALPMTEGILASNERQIARAVQEIVTTGSSRIGFYGLSFKEGTDDLRESPYVEVAERLLGKGKEIVVYDPGVRLQNLMGKNKSYIDEHLPHLARSLREDVQALEQCGLIVIAHSVEKSLRGQWLDAGICILDLTIGKDACPHPNFRSLV